MSFNKFLNESVKKPIQFSIDTDNAAFEDDFNNEVNYVLDQVQEVISSKKSLSKLRDSNGNVIGGFDLSSRIKVKFDTDNAAFDDAFDNEIEYVLKQVARAIKRDGDAKLRDSNGNTIGDVMVE